MRLDDVPRELLVALALAALAWAAVLSVRGWLRRHRMRQRFDRGREGEREAAALLATNGFVIEGFQVSATYEVRVDDQAIPISVCADYVVAKGGKRWVAEVKTGRTATRIDTSATRRQLLEYAHAFEVDGILLVDADARSIHSVSFAPKESSRGAMRAIGFVLAFSLFAAALIALR